MTFAPRASQQVGGERTHDRPAARYGPVVEQEPLSAIGLRLVSRPLAATRAMDTERATDPALGYTAAACVGRNGPGRSCKVGLVHRGGTREVVDVAALDVGELQDLLVREIAKGLDGARGAWMSVRREHYLHIG
jgi:hypothetical protein